MIPEAIEEKGQVYVHVNKLLEEREKTTRSMLELERYKNIIDELEKWLLEQLYIEAENPYEEKIIKIENPEIASILNKLKELKGSDN